MCVCVWVGCTKLGLSKQNCLPLSTSTTPTTMNTNNWTPRTDPPNQWGVHPTSPLPPPAPLLSSHGLINEGARAFLSQFYSFNGEEVVDKNAPLPRDSEEELDHCNALAPLDTGRRMTQNTRTRAGSFRRPIRRASEGGTDSSFLVLSATSNNNPHKNTRLFGR